MGIAGGQAELGLRVAFFRLGFGLGKQLALGFGRLRERRSGQGGQEEQQHPDQTSGWPRGRNKSSHAARVELLEGLASCYLIKRAGQRQSNARSRIFYRGRSFFSTRLALRVTYWGRPASMGTLTSPSISGRA